MKAARHGVWANLEFANRNATVYLQETNGFQHKDTEFPTFEGWYDWIQSTWTVQPSLIQTPWGSRSCHQKRLRVCGEMLPVLLLFVVKPKGDPSLQLTGTNHLVAGRVSWDDKCHSHYTDYPLVNSHITMENHHAINGKINYFNGPFSIANCNKLPEGIPYHSLRNRLSKKASMPSQNSEVLGPCFNQSFWSSSSVARRRSPRFAVIAVAG